MDEITETDPCDVLVQICKDILATTTVAELEATIKYYGPDIKTLDDTLFLNFAGSWYPKVPSVAKAQDVLMKVCERTGLMADYLEHAREGLLYGIV